MKNLFALMALAGLAAFQVGCGGADSTPAKTTPMTPPAPITMPGSPTMGGAEKKDADEKPADGDKKEGDEAAPGGDEKPSEEATPDKKDE